MAGPDNDNDSFSDDDFDNLNPEVLQGLETQAIQFTQHQQQTQYDTSDYGDDIDEDDLEDTEVVEEVRNPSTQAWEIVNAPQQQPRLLSNNAIPRTLQPYESQHAPAPRVFPTHLQYPAASSSRNVSAARGLVSPQNNSGEREEFRQQRYSNNVAPQRNTGSLAERPQIPENVRLGSTQDNPATLEALQRQLQEIMRERDSLKQDVNMKAGEIAIVRSKQEKAHKEYERELAAVKKINAEEQAKQKRAIEQAKDAEKRAATELEFMKRDLAEEGQKVKNLKKATNKNAPTTPTKTKLPHRPHRDGFDDDELLIISPSKFKARLSHPATPTKAGQRKRKAAVAESPKAKLEIHVEDSNVIEVEKQQSSVIIDTALLERLGRQDDRLDFLQNMLNHRPFRGHLQTFEAFSKLFFPSSPQESFSSIILGKLPGLTSKRSPDDFPIDFCELILSMWARCLQEKYTKPIYLFLDLLTHALNLKTLAIAPHILDSLLPITQTTCNIIAIPRYKQMKISPELEEDISLTSCLSLLYLTAMGCVSHTSYLVRFWRLVHRDFVITLLSADQLPADFGLMLQLLRMSVLRDNNSIGPISADPNSQDKDTSDIIEKATYLLMELPLATPIKTTKLEPELLSQLRLEILRTIDALSRIKIGGKAHAKHPHVIGRLVSIISAETDSLYDYHGGARHSISSEIVSLATKLLHYLVMGFEAEVGRMQEKLAVVQGGTHRHLVSLARLALSDEEVGVEGVLQRGIKVGVRECARDLLEVACTMEEADAIHEALVGVEY